MNEVALRTERTAVDVRREMLNRPEVMARLEPVEKAVFLASASTPFYEMDANELTAELSKVLRFICKDIGYRITDDADFGYTVVRVVEILKRYYDNLTLKDFRIAFEMSLTGALDEYLPKNSNGKADRGHYQRFNAEYVCKILDAYKSRRANVFSKAYNTPAERVEMSAEEKGRYQNETRQRLVDLYNDFVASGQLGNISPIGEMLYYDLLREVKLAPEIDIKESELQREWDKLVFDARCKGYVADVRQLEREKFENEDVKTRAYFVARKRVLEQTLSDMRERGIKIEDYIKTERYENE